MITWLLFALLICAVSAGCLLGSLWILSGLYPVEALRSSLPYRPYNFDEPRRVGLGLKENLQLSDIPGPIIIALLLHEDDQFFRHKGFNVSEMLRAARNILRLRRRIHGGSSISQQVVKLVFLRRHRSNKLRYYLLKLVEFPLTLRLERTFTKVEILTIYVNCIRLSCFVVFGLREGAKHFFHKDVDQLNLVEVMWLLGVIPAPARYETNIRIKGDASDFRFTNAAEKFKDLIRILTRARGWYAAEDLSLVSHLDAISIMSAYSGLSETDLPVELRLAAKVKAGLLLQELRRLVATFALEAKLWTGEFAPDPAMFEKFSLAEE